MLLSLTLAMRFQEIIKVTLARPTNLDLGQATILPTIFLVRKFHQVKFKQSQAEIVQEAEAIEGRHV